MRVPVKMDLSPALARSRVSPRRMTSMVRGIEPAGISVAFSCTRTRCQSIKTDSPTECLSRQLVLFGHDALLHFCGSQYLNCCGTGSDVAPQISPSEVRVTVPEKLVSLPTRSDFMSRTRSSAEVL